MTSSKSVRFYFLRPGVVAVRCVFADISQKFQVMISLTVGAPPSILYANTTEGERWIVKT